MDTNSNIKPRLKTGTIILPLPSRTFVGNGHRGIEIFSPARAAVNAFDGTKSSDEIGATLNIPPADVEELINELTEAQLLDTTFSKISVHSRFHSRNEHRASHDGDDSNDGAYQQMQAKIASELSFTTWLDGVRDGGVTAVSERRNTRIAIHGDSRIATQLFGILLASGLSQTTLEASEKRMIGEIDTCAGFIRSSDIGAPLHSRAREMSRELSLFPPLQPMPTRKLIAKPSSTKHRSIDGATRNPNTHIAQSLPSQSIFIAVGDTPADVVQGWMSTGIPHLFVDNPDGASLSIGPLVIPGKTPCARCISLAREEQSQIWSGVDWQRNILPSAEVPVSVAHHVAGLIALELLRYIDTGNSEIVGSKIRLNYHAPLQSGRTIYARHPACGCGW